MKNIVVAGGGVLGSQIAFQSAFKGFQTRFWLRSEDSIKRTMPKIERLKNIYLSELDACEKSLGQKGFHAPRGLIDDFENLTVDQINVLRDNVQNAYDNLKYFTDIEAAVENADYVIETIAEIPSEKEKFYTTMAPFLPEKTIIATNSSTLLPSSFASFTGRPEKYLAMHFANSIWRNNIAEVMGHPGTSEESFQAIVQLSNEIGMIPLEVKKEQPGYLLNSLLVPLLSAAEALLVNGVSDPQTIDKAWQLGTGAPAGPFRILDVVGLETAYNIALMRASQDSDPNSQSNRIAKMLKEYIDAGKTGINAGEGFYKY